MRARSVLLLLILLCCVVPSAGAVTTTGGASLEGLPNLWEDRAGVSENEPNFCTTEQASEVNRSATSAGSIEAGPPKFLVEDVEPGTTYRHCFFVFNRSTKSRTFELSTLDVTGSLDPAVTLETSIAPAVVGTWIQLPVTRIDVAPGERVVIPYRVVVPQQPPVGTSIGGIRITDVSGADVGGGTLVQKGLVLQLQVTFPGGAAKDLEISDVEATKLIWRGRDPSRYRLEYTVSNRGTVVDSITPTLRIDGLFGRSVAKITAQPEVIVPGSAQIASMRWDDPPWVGRYTPKLLVKSENGTRTIDLPTLWVIPPWPYLLALALALLAAIWAIVRRRRAADDWRDYLEEDPDELDGHAYEYDDH